MSERPTRPEEYAAAVRVSMTLEELRVAARDYLADLYGQPGKGNDPDRWMEKYGFLCDFADTLINPPGTRPPA